MIGEMVPHEASRSVDVVVSRCAVGDGDQLSFAGRLRRSATARTRKSAVDGDECRSDQEHVVRTPSGRAPGSRVACCRVAADHAAKQRCRCHRSCIQRSRASLTIALTTGCGGPATWVVRSCVFRSRCSAARGHGATVGSSRVPGGKTSELLVRLALEAGVLVRADRLVDDLWAADAVTTRRNTLQSKVARLRRALGDPPVDRQRRRRLHARGRPVGRSTRSPCWRDAVTASRLLDAGDDRGAADLCASTLELLPRRRACRPPATATGSRRTGRGSRRRGMSLSRPSSRRGSRLGDAAT